MIMTKLLQEEEEEGFSKTNSTTDKLRECDEQIRKNPQFVGVV